MKTKNLAALAFAACVLVTVGCTPTDENTSTTGESGEEAQAASQTEEESSEGEQEPTLAEGSESPAEPGSAGGDASTAVVGQQAPSFSLSDEAGNTHSLSDYAGKMVVLEWVNPQCPYVVRHYEADTMETTSTDFGDDVVWLAINSSHFITAEAAQEFKEAEGFDYPVLLDADGTVGHAYGARTTPHMYVIDAEGVLAYAGAIDNDPRGTVEEPTNHVVAAVNAIQQGERPNPSATEPYGCTVKYE